MSYQSIVDELNLKVALTRGSEPNDLLLPRAEDRVGGEVGNRFLEALRRDLERGRYDPTPAYTVRVPKSIAATRPASLLSLDDRVVYESLVATLRPRIEKYLLGSDIVFWPRGIASSKAWLKFEHAPVADPSQEYIIVADISGFYESIDHNRLGEFLVRATGKRNCVDALVELLGRVMGSGRGIPQGLEPSDPLATAYLAETDFAMVRDGYGYVRHGDDIRITAETYDGARAALFALETRTRSAGLLLSGHKTKILRAETYRLELQSVEMTMAETKAKVLSGKLTTLEEDPDELAAAIDMAEMEQLGWDFFYHGRVSLEEVIEELEPTLEPSEVEVAEELLVDTWEHRPGTPHGLASNAFHQRLVASLVRLAAGRSAVALDIAGDILVAYPEKTEVVCSYLLALAERDPRKVGAAAARVLAPGRFRTEWETAWTLRVLTAVPDDVPDEVHLEVQAITSLPFEGWLAATEGAKVLGATGTLGRDTLTRLWNACPPVFRADLVVAAALMKPHAEWADTFLSAVRDNRIHEVVLHQLEQA